MVADEGGLGAETAIQPEQDDLQDARCRPGLGDRVAAFGLRGGCEDHFRHAVLDVVETAPGHLVIVPDLTAGEGDDGTCGRELFRKAENKSELLCLMRSSYVVLSLKNKN